jgi:hypothetical protein
LNFSLKPGNLHDISCAEEVLSGCTGTVIGHGGRFPPPKDSLAKNGIGPIAKHRQNMAPTRKKKNSLKNGQS